MRDGLNGFTATVLMGLMITCWPLASAGNTCDPCTEPNGRGIYILERVDYCVHFQSISANSTTGVATPKRFCPEAFVQAFDKQAPRMPYVELAGRLFDGPQTKIESKKGFKVSAVLDNTTQVSITQVKTMATPLPKMGARLSFQYKAPTVTGVVSGSDVSRLLFQFEEVPGLSLQFKEFIQDTKDPKTNKIERRYRYAAEWQFKGTKTRFCPDENAISLLPDKRVDGYSGKVSSQTGVFTTACASGAIARCMGWGYNPSLLALKPPDANALLGACIQAKRAAFFLQFGDTQSYTLDGTQFALDDKYKDLGTPQDDTTGALEAIWTEDGAQCLNPQNHRVQPPKKAPALSTTAQLPECTPEDLWGLGILATGRAP